MWFMLIPLVMLLGMTPFMLAEQDLARQKQYQIAVDWSRRLLSQHQAAKQGCSLPGINCVGELAEEIFSRQLPLGLNADTGGVLRSYHNGIQLVSFLDEMALDKSKNRVRLGTVSVGWARLNHSWRQFGQYRPGAGYWSENGDVKGVTLFDNSFIQVNLPSNIKPAIGGPVVVE